MAKASKPEADSVSAPATIVETNQTVVEDNTDAPETSSGVEYEAEEETLANGTVLTTYMAPVGGFIVEAEIIGAADEVSE